ncbi:DUF7537 family lipoprotein [Halomarina rubra]|uniref:Outer membrane lipoprotein-sorting protein n=1 Tax=Halomarina rubra TaxID=2071873 RepID=A0ABD6ARU3_9EURY|nr:hypothetical protein [Halomarina rubra]
MQRAGVSLVLVVLVVLAGCSNAGSTAPAVTPAAVPDDEATATPQPARLTAESAADVDRVATAHRAATAGRSYTAHLSVRTVTTDAEGNRSRLLEGRALVEGSDRRLDSESVMWSIPGGEGHADVRERFVDGSARLTRHVQDGATEYAGAPDEWSTVTNRSLTRLVDLFAGDDATVERREGVDGTRFVVETTTPPPQWNVSSFDARLVVRESGLVERLDASYVRTVSGSVVAVETTVLYSAVGTTTVERPPWFDEARRAAANGSSTD